MFFQCKWNVQRTWCYYFAGKTVIKINNGILWYEIWRFLRNKNNFKEKNTIVLIYKIVIFYDIIKNSAKSLLANKLMTFVHSSFNKLTLKKKSIARCIQNQIVKLKYFYEICNDSLNINKNAKKQAYNYVIRLD